MNSEVYRYGLSAKISRTCGFVLFIASLLRGILYLFEGVYVLTRGTASGSITYIYYFLLVISFYSLLAPSLLLLVIHLFCDIAIDNLGLHIKHVFNPIVINWENILDIETVVLFGFVKNPKRKVIVCNAKLPLIYRLYGLVYTGSMMPVIPVSPSIQGYPRLMEKLTIRIKREGQRSHRQGRVSS